MWPVLLVGMYMFTWTTVSLGSTNYYSDMFMDDDIIAASLGSDSGSDPATSIVFIHCESGARVYIQCGPYSCRPRNDRAYGLQSFAGFLVAAIGE